MLARVVLRLLDGSTRTLGHGDLVGRLWSAALQLDDPSISEAHAMVSLRGGELWLLGLRGLFVVDGKPLTEVALVPGLRLRLSRAVELVVQSVELPTEVLALEGERLPLQVLMGSVSLVLRPLPVLHARYQEAADAWIWWTGDGWRIRPRGQADRELRPGDAIELGGARFVATSMALSTAGPDQTRGAGGIAAPLTIRARYDTAHVLREGAPTLSLSGQSARIFSELAACAAPVAWDVIARQLWSDPDIEQGELRRRWDVALVRLRSKLREADLRPGLIRADGTGNVELVLAVGDRVEDES